MSSNSRPVVIKFFCNVNEFTVNQLLQVIDKKLLAGVNEFTILISSQGGSVFHGISAYNYLKGIPATVKVHNFGSVNSSASVIFCAGSERFSVPDGTFLIHPVRAAFRGGENLAIDDLEERIKGVKLDSENIAGVISSATGKTEDEILEMMRNRTNLNPEQAKEFGFVHEIKEELFDSGSEIINIIDKPPQPQGLPFRIQQ